MRKTNLDNVRVMWKIKFCKNDDFCITHTSLLLAHTFIEKNRPRNRKHNNFAKRAVIRQSGP
jgi:hypothetical protein